MVIYWKRVIEDGSVSMWWNITNSIRSGIVVGLKSAERVFDLFNYPPAVNVETID